MISLPDFTSYNREVWHCERCHRLVRWYDTDNPADIPRALLAHREFNCVENAMVAAGQWEPTA